MEKLPASFRASNETTVEFRKLFCKLPNQAKKTARACCLKFDQDPDHPSLNRKIVRSKTFFSKLIREDFGLMFEFLSPHPLIRQFQQFLYDVGFGVDSFAVSHFDATFFHGEVDAGEGDTCLVGEALAVEEAADQFLRGGIAPAEQLGILDLGRAGGVVELKNKQK